MVWTVRGSNPSGDEFFRTRPDRPWSPSASYAVRAVSFSEVNRPGRGVNYPLPSSAEVKKRVELWLYPSLFLNGSYRVKFACTFTSQKTDQQIHI